MTRHSREHPCAICGGYQELPRNRGVRCYGFVAHNGLYCACTREEYGGKLFPGPNGTFLHRLTGQCDCGSLGHRGLRRDVDRVGTPNPIPNAAQRIEKACAIWLATQSITGTKAERYLREARGITCPLPACLRYGTLWHAPTRRELPTMVARVDNVRGEFTAIQRTYLQPDGSDRIDRRMLGPVRGGAVRLTVPNLKLGLAEGIETALSVISALPEFAIWAALSTSGLRTIELPPLPLASEVVIFADRDPAGLEAAKDAGQRLAGEGRHVRIAKPPEGANDFNDVLRRVGGVG